jgi:F1F0 ATPase subunit 2
MIEIPALLLAFLAGAALGGIFFGGLWWTIRKGLSSKQPALWFVPSLLLRMSIVLAGLYVVAHGHWQRLLLCLFGFVIARLIVKWLTRENLAPAAPAVHYAP